MISLPLTDYLTNLCDSKCSLSCVVAARGSVVAAFMRRRTHWRCVRQRKKLSDCRKLYQLHAKTVTTTLILHRLDVIVISCITHSCHLTCVNQLCVKEWEQLCNQCTSNKLYSVQLVIGRNTCSSPSRYDSVFINRLRIGHRRLTDSYLLNGESQPVCQACHSSLTVRHILVDCTRYSAAHQRYFGVDTLKDVFENVASCNIIAFVRDVYFYNHV